MRDLAEVLGHRDAEIETLRCLVTTLRRRQFGRLSVKRDSDQLDLGLEAIEEQIGAVDAETPASVSPVDEAKTPRRKLLPEHLPSRPTNRDVAIATQSKDI